MALKEHNFKVDVVAKKPTKGAPKKGNLQNLGAGMQAPIAITLNKGAKVVPDWPPQPVRSRPNTADAKVGRSQQTSSLGSRPATASLTHRPSTAQDRFLQRYSLRTTRPESSGFTGIIRDFNISRYPPPNVFGSRPLSSLAWRSIPPPPSSRASSRPKTAPSAVSFSKPERDPSPPSSPPRSITPGAVSPYAVRYPKAILCSPSSLRLPKEPATGKPRRKRSASEVAQSSQQDAHPRVYAVRSEDSSRTSSASSRRSRLESSESAQPRKFRKSIWADELNFVVTDEGLKEPGLPFRPKHWGATAEMVYFEPGRAREAYFDPTATGSYPPRAPELETFSDLKYHHLHKCRVEDIAEMMLILKPDPETDAQPVEGGVSPGLSWVDVNRVPRKLTLPLELFDYPEMDLRHPSHDIIEVKILAHPAHSITCLLHINNWIYISSLHQQFRLRAWVYCETYGLNCERVTTWVNEGRLETQSLFTRRISVFTTGLL